MKREKKMCCVDGCYEHTNASILNMIKKGWESITWKRTHGVYLCPVHAIDKKAIAYAKKLSEKMYLQEDLMK